MKLQRMGHPILVSTLLRLCFVRMMLEIPAQGLFAFNGFEEGFEVALAEAAAALALDDLVEDGGAVFYGAGEDLEHVAFVVAVDEDAEFFELADGLVDLA